MRKKNKLLWIITFFTMYILLLTGCGSTSSTTAKQATAGLDELDITIREVSNYLNNVIPHGSKIVILSIQSASESLSNYIIDELISNAVNDRVFTVVDRQQLDLIRAEQSFQFSGEVADDEALAIGRFFGAQTIVLGAVSSLGNRYRMTIRALDVQTATVQGQFNRNLTAWETILALMQDENGTAAVTSSGRMTASGSTSRVSSQSANSNITGDAERNPEQAFENVRRYFGINSSGVGSFNIGEKVARAFSFHEVIFNYQRLNAVLDYWKNLPYDGTYYLDRWGPDRTTDTYEHANAIRLSLQLRYDNDDNRYLHFEIDYPDPENNGKRTIYHLSQINPGKALEIAQAMVGSVK